MQCKYRSWFDFIFGDLGFSQLKVAFSQKVQCAFHIAKINISNHYPDINLNKLFTVIGEKFKFQVQDRDLEYSFWQCEKHIALSEKKPPWKLTGNKITFQPEFYSCI